ncbi:MAG: MerR family transcriptional regulator [candidate division WOR-3 bacterium]
MRGKRKKDVKKLYYTKSEVMQITGLNYQQIKAFEDKKFITPAKIQNRRRYYSYESLKKLKLASALLENHSINDIVSNFDKMVLEAKMSLYKKTLSQIKNKIEMLLNGHQS